MELNYSNSLAFAIVFLRANMPLFWTPDIPFNIGLGLMTPGTKNVNILVDKG